jgi:hypothetical protein
MAERNAALREYVDSVRFIDPQTGEEYSPAELPEVDFPEDDDPPSDD